MIEHRLSQDSDGMVYLHTDADGDDDTDGLSILGMPSPRLYHDVPMRLWPVLTRIIEDHRDARRTGCDYRRGVETDYWRAKGAIQ